VFVCVREIIYKGEKDICWCSGFFLFFFLNCFYLLFVFIIIICLLLVLEIEPRALCMLHVLYHWAAPQFLIVFYMWIPMLAWLSLFLSHINESVSLGKGWSEVALLPVHFLRTAGTRVGTVVTLGLDTTEPPGLPFWMQAGDGELGRR
jgi:hypothetical protein